VHLAASAAYVRRVPRKHLLLLLLAFALSVLVRAPHIGRPLSAHHEYCSALVLTILENWRHGGFSYHKGSPSSTFHNPADRYIHPASYTFATRDGHLYYLSHPQLAYYLPHLLYSLAGRAPSERSLTWFNMLFHLLTSVLLYRVLRECLPPAQELERDLVPLSAALLYLFMPAPLWFHGNAYMADMFVQNLWIIHLLVAVRVFTGDGVPQGWRMLLFCLTLFLVLFTNWLGVFVAATGAGLAWFRWRRGGGTAWLHLALLTVCTTVAALAVVLGIYAMRLGFSDLLTYLWYRFQDRATMQFWEGGIVFHLGRLLEAYRISWLPFLLLVPALFLVFRQRRWVQPGRGLKLFLLLTLLPVLLDHAVLLKYAGHDLATLKAGFFLCGAGAWLGSLLASRTRKPAFTMAGITAVLCLAGVLWFYRVNPPLDDAAYARQKHWGEQIASVAAPEEVVFALDFDPEPQEQWYARRTLKPVNSLEEAHAFLRQRGIRSGVVFRPEEGGGLAHERIRAPQAPGEPP
jgi:hypothetical protein